MPRLRLLGLATALIGVALIAVAGWRVHQPWRLAVGAPCHGLLAVILLLPAGLLLVLFGAHLATGPAWARRL